MTRTSLPIAVAVAVSAGLMLTACGGGGSSNSDKISSRSHDRVHLGFSYGDPVGHGVGRRQAPVDRVCRRI